MRPRGAVTLPVAGHDVQITGGPFDALPAGAAGLCLEPLAERAAEARWHLPIPDYGVPEPDALRAVLLTMLATMRAAPDGAYHIGCKAGLGRTGLAMGCLARLAGIAGDPVAWVRTHYDAKAIETPGQEDFVRGFIA